MTFSIGVASALVPVEMGEMGFIRDGFCVSIDLLDGRHGFRLGWRCCGFGEEGNVRCL